MIVNEKNNVNYGISYSNTSYDQTNTFDAADDKNFENYSSNIRYNFNFSPTTQLSSKLILNKTDSSFKKKNLTQNKENKRRKIVNLELTEEEITQHKQFIKKIPSSIW